MNCFKLTLTLTLFLLLNTITRCDEDDFAEIKSEGTIVDEPSSDTTNEEIPVVQHELREDSEKFSFQAEVNRLMDIIINSLYSNKEVFLRELISNASDALDKIRYLSLTNRKELGEGADANLEIKISLDRQNNVLKIRDRGIGMTKDDLIKNLGTIAKSGTSAFLDKIKSTNDMNLIGQFGVGFYSVYLVSDYVEVITKHNDDKQYVWESKADGQFAISEDKDGEELGRGTQVNIYLKPETQEYANEDTLRRLIKKYSEFISFPIYLFSEHEIEIEQDETESEDEYQIEDEVMDEDEVKEEEKDVKKEKVWDWELINKEKALWLRAPGDITDEEYQNLYAVLTKSDDKKAKTWVHFKAEGDVEFTALLYVPETAPFDYYDRYYEKDVQNVRLYVRRVFISDEFENLLPRYLSFLVGVVDSDTLPLNVSREMLQQHSALKTIKKKLVKKVLDILKKLADEEKEQIKEEKEEEEARIARGDPEPEDKELKPYKYMQFWNSFGRALRLGIIEDKTNRNRLSKLLRFYTSKSPKDLTSLDDYVERMKSEQKYIYYLCGMSMEEVTNSPFLEKLHAKDIEVIYFPEAMDEYMMQHLLDYDDVKFSDASKEDMKIDESEDKDYKKKLRKKFKPLTEWWKTAVKDNSLNKVKISSRLADTPCVIVTSKYGWSANMERIMASQALTDPMRSTFMKGKKTLEINPGHPLIKELQMKVEMDPEDENLKTTAILMYEAALLESGFSPKNQKEFANRVHVMIKNALDIKTELSDIEDPSLEDIELSEEDEDEDNFGPGPNFSGYKPNPEDDLIEIDNLELHDQKIEL